MRQSHILILLEEVRDNISFIQSEYIKATDDNRLKGQLQVKVKSSLEHLRSCLDYCAHDIYELIIQPAHGNTDRSKDIYFPYGITPNDFHSNVCKKLSRDFKFLNNDVYCLLESIQPYKTGDNWLIDLCKKANTSKHNDLIEQKVSKGVILSDEHTNFLKIGDNCSGVVIRNCKFNGKTVKYMEFNGTEITTDTNLDEVGLFIIDWSTFEFEGSNIDIIKFLNAAHENISDLQSKLYVLLNHIS